jgi:hypothetical protein
MRSLRSFLLFFCLHDFQHTDRPATQYQTGICRRIVNNKNVNWIAVLGFGRWDETPVIRIGQANYKWFCQRKNTKLTVKFQLRSTSSGRFHYCVGARIVGPSGIFKKLLIRV